jgi:antirestriction protein ArdC
MGLKDVYQRITDEIIAELEKGVCPWMKPWHAVHLSDCLGLPLRHSGCAQASPRRQR